MNVMFDTMIFDNIVKEEIDISSLIERVSIYATHIQRDELTNTRNSDLRNRFIELFNVITDIKPTESIVIGVSRVGEAKIGGEIVPTESAYWNLSNWDASSWGNTNLCDHIREELNQKNGGKEPNNSRDALIAETAIKNNYILITHDSHLSSVCKKLGVAVMSLEELIQSQDEES